MSIKFEAYQIRHTSNGGKMAAEEGTMKWIVAPVGAIKIKEIHSRSYEDETFWKDGTTTNYPPDEWGYGATEEEAWDDIIYKRKNP